MAFKYTPYKKSKEENEYYSALKNLLNKQPTWNGGTYQNKINEAMKNIENRGKFSYNPNEDATYQSLRDMYVNKGRQAATDVASQVAALSGGYGNSYAATASNQAYQGYLTQLAELIPQLKESARADYNAESERLDKLYALYDAAYNREYGEYNDKLNKWNADRSFYGDMYNNERNYGRSAYENDRNFAQGNYQYDTNYAYQKERDKVADEQWQKQLDYQKERDRVADEQWQKQFNLSASKASSSGSSGSSKSSGTSSSKKTTKTLTSSDKAKIYDAWVEGGKKNDSEEIAKMASVYGSYDDLFEYLDELANEVENGKFNSAYSFYKNGGTKNAHK